MLIDAEDSLLLVVDVQERLLPAVHDPQRVLRNVEILIRAARRLGIPIVATEQNPQGLGHTVTAIANLLPQDSTIEKTSFSALDKPPFGERLAESGRSKIVVCGAEAHVCVLQTASELQAVPGWQVFLVADATASRTEEKRRRDRVHRDDGLRVAAPFRPARIPRSPGAGQVVRSAVSRLSPEGIRCFCCARGPAETGRS
jgi:nicotinamidase-related amidase